MTPTVSKSASLLDLIYFNQYVIEIEHDYERDVCLIANIIALIQDSDLIQCPFLSEISPARHFFCSCLVAASSIEQAGMINPNKRD